MPTLEFKGKQFVYSHHLSVPFRELKIDKKKSLPAKGKKPSLNDNLIIHGDNLEALKALLPTHAGKIDCIFIDPPYNTGNEGWCYNDNVRSPLMKEWLKKSANPVDKDDLERHDKWLCMMWPRLAILSELLSDDGVIIVAIDDNEHADLKLIMDELIGEDRYVTSICWRAADSSNNDVKQFSLDHNYLVFYAKGIEWEANLRDRTDADNSHYKNPDNDPRGPWFPGNLSSPNPRKNLKFDIISPSGKRIKPPANGWRWKEEKLLLKIERGEIIFSDDETRILRKTYLIDQKGRASSSLWIDLNETGHNRNAKYELNRIFSELQTSEQFKTPKPTKLLDKIISVVCDTDSVILDSFSGSGTTAHAVLNANKKDKGNRKFILVECENYADKITAERVRRVIKGYKFKGKQKEELYSEKITWSKFEKKQKEILDHIESIENLQGGDYDKIKKELKDGILKVTGERDITEKTPGLGGSFTYCELGEPIDVESLLTGKDLPAFNALAQYVFYTATGQSLDKVAKAGVDGFIGETDLFRLHLFYQPDKSWLRSNEAALNIEKVEAINKANKSHKRSIVFAVAKFMSQKELTKQGIEFCQLPYAVHRILGD